MPFTIIDEPLPGLLILEHVRHHDARGYFEEAFSIKACEGVGIPTVFVQDNHSRSRRGVLRGLHAQTEPAMGKLLSVIRGTIQLVELDIRHNSETFGQHASISVSDSNGRTVWIPPGFANGFLVLSDEADVYYKCTAPWNPGGEVFVNPMDPSLGIVWDPSVGIPLLNERDAGAGMLERWR